MQCTAEVKGHESRRCLRNVKVVYFNLAIASGSIVETYVKSLEEFNPSVSG